MLGLVNMLMLIKQCGGIPVGKIPTLEEAKEKLAYIQKYGATATAFHFGKIFDLPKN